MRRQRLVEAHLDVAESPRGEAGEDVVALHPSGVRCGAPAEGLGCRTLAIGVAVNLAAVAARLVDVRAFEPRRHVGPLLRQAGVPVMGPHEQPVRVPGEQVQQLDPVSYTHLRAHETDSYLV